MPFAEFAHLEDHLARAPFFEIPVADFGDGGKVFFEGSDFLLGEFHRYGSGAEDVCARSADCGAKDHAGAILMRDGATESRASTIFADRLGRDRLFRSRRRFHGGLGRDARRLKRVGPVGILKGVGGRRGVG